MAFNNVIIQGYKKTLKLIAQGFSRDSGVFIKINFLRDEAYIDQKLNTVLNVDQKLSTVLNIDQHLSTESGL